MTKLFTNATLVLADRLLPGGWLLEENEEVWDDVPCLRLTVDQSGSSGKILSTLWLRQTSRSSLCSSS